MGRKLILSGHCFMILYLQGDKIWIQKLILQKIKMKIVT